MADPKTLGNRADEQGEHESGADFSAINRSPAPEPTDPIHVMVQRDNESLLITEINRRFENLPTQRRIELQQGPRDLLDAQIFEDPAMLKRVSGAITRKSSRGALIYYAITPETAVGVWGERVIIKQDSQESAYSCRSCRGSGHTEEQCPTCKGSQIDIDGASPCRSCWVLGYGRDLKSPCGFIECSVCKGSGWRAGVVIPEVAQTMPITGIVVSVGPECVNLQLGDRVLHSKYSGHTQTTPDGEFYTVMQEHEVLELLKDLRKN
jgi:co-chaperonin GroES (HSP10)